MDTGNVIKKGGLPEAIEKLTEQISSLNCLLDEVYVKSDPILVKETEAKALAQGKEQVMSSHYTALIYNEISRLRDLADRLVSLRRMLDL